MQEVKKVLVLYIYFVVMDYPNIYIYILYISPLMIVLNKYHFIIYIQYGYCDGFFPSARQQIGFSLSRFSTCSFAYKTAAVILDRP